MSQHFNFVESPLKGLYRIDRNPMMDSRGFFSRIFCNNELKEIGFSQSVAQINLTLTKQKGSIRGMHFQNPPYMEKKIVTCLQGEVLDIAVDIRKGSPTFLNWHSEILNSENQSSFCIPNGFAHGFQALTSDCEILYIHSTFYSPSHEGALNPFDPMLKINWPLDVTEMSERDRNHAMLDNKFRGIEVL